MPNWSKTKDIKLTTDEQIAILRNAKFNYKTWNDVPPFNIGQKTIDELRDFEDQEGIKFGYDEKENRVSIHYLLGYPDKLALK